MVGRIDAAGGAGTGSLTNSKQTVSFHLGECRRKTSRIVRKILQELRRPDQSGGVPNTETTVQVFDKEFVDRNVHVGVGTMLLLGCDVPKPLRRPAALESERIALEEEIVELEGTLANSHDAGHKRERVSKARQQLEAACWESFKAHREDFGPVLLDHRHSRSTFCDKVLREERRRRKAVSSLRNLKVRARLVLSPALALPPYQFVSFHHLHELEVALLSGRPSLSSNDGVLRTAIAESQSRQRMRAGALVATAGDRSSQISHPGGPGDSSSPAQSDHGRPSSHDYRRIVDAYERGISDVADQVSALCSSDDEVLDCAILAAQHRALDAAFRINLEQAKLGLADPAMRARTIDTWGYQEALNDVIRVANAELLELTAQRHNSSYRTDLVDEIWGYLVEERRREIDIYKRACSDDRDLQRRTIRRLAARNAQLKATIKKVDRIREASLATKSLVDKMNRTLSSFGFSPFRLEYSPEDVRGCRVVRLDKHDVCTTISEQDRRFIGFLYFFHTLEDKDWSGGSRLEKTVIVEDPVDGPDADKLFVVGALTRRLIARLRSTKNGTRGVHVVSTNAQLIMDLEHIRTRHRQEPA